MIKIENIDVHGFEAAVRGMRNPMNSWDKSDTMFTPEWEFNICILGEYDFELMKKLIKSGTDHSKFMRMITVTMDITAPLYWWKEFDTYKVGTVRNSCSTMHTIHKKKIEASDFSVDVLDDMAGGILGSIVNTLEYYRERFLETGDKKYWRRTIQLLPSSYNQRSTVQLNYQVLRNIYHARKNHKLDEWHDFCKMIETLPYSELITM